MALLQKLKEALGFGSGSSTRESGDPTVTVEKAHEAIDPTADEADGEGVPEPSSGDGSSAAAPAESSTEPVEEAETDTTEAVEEAKAVGETEAEAVQEAEVVEEAEAEAVQEAEAEAVGEVEADDDPNPADETGADSIESAETPDGDPVEQITGIGPAYGERLAAMGIETVDDLAVADPAAVADEASVGKKRATTWIDRANEF